jgi:hypothetical protein
MLTRIGNFFRYLANEVFENWAELQMPEHSLEMIELKQRWELLKRGFSGQDEGVVLFDIPGKLRKYVRHGLLEGGMLPIKEELMKGFFTNVLNRIKARIEQQLEAKQEEPNHAIKPVVLFLCGGFSESPYLWFVAPAPGCLLSSF